MKGIKRITMLKAFIASNLNSMHSTSCIRISALHQELNLSLPQLHHNMPQDCTLGSKRGIDSIGGTSGVGSGESCFGGDDHGH